MIAPADSAWNSSKDKSSFADFLDQSLRLADKILTGTRHYLRRLLTTVGYEGGRRCFPLVERKWPSKRRSSVVWTVSRVDKRIGPSLRGFIQLKWCWRSTKRLSPSSSSHVLSCSHSETCPGRNQLENLNCHFHSIPWNNLLVWYSPIAFCYLICSEAGVGGHQWNREAAFSRKILHDRMRHWRIPSFGQHSLVPALDPATSRNGTGKIIVHPIFPAFSWSIQFLNCNSKNRNNERSQLHLSCQIS
jgi:hypothetical protein